MMTNTQPAPITQIELYERLCRSFREERLPSSLLFAGKKGVGKWPVAHALAKTITCLNPSDGYCGECASCRQAEQFCHPDIYYLFPLPKDEDKADKLYYPYLQQKQQRPFSDGSDDVTSFITIDNIRKFQSNLARHPSLSKYKVGIVYEAERMLPATMDSLLKTLEEPPRDSFLLVCTDQPRFLLATIRSRLQRVNFGALEPEFIASFLLGNFEVNEKEAGLITRFAGGTLYNIEQLVEKAFFDARETAFDMLVNAVTLTAPDFVVKYSGHAAIQEREKVERLLVHWQSMLRDLMLLNTLPLQTGIDPAQALINFDLADRYLEHRERFASLKEVEKQIEKLEQVRNELRRNVNPRMAAISFLVALTSRQ
jgi:DNA polymerase III subunit delta'